MHLSSFGLISLNGTVSKPEPGLDFSEYQVALANYSTTLALRSRLREQSVDKTAIKSEPNDKLIPASPRRINLDDAAVFKRTSIRNASALVRRFRS